MIANIPFALTECLAPKEVGELLTAAEQDNRPVEDCVVFAVREWLQNRRSAVKTQPEGASHVAALAA